MLCRLLWVKSCATCYPSSMPYTTSRLYGIGKGLPLKKAMSNTSFAKQLEQVLYCSTREEMKTSGEKVLVELYGGKNTESLDSLRIRKFKDKVVRCASSVEIQNLPPTLDAGMYHIYRAFYQAKCWMSKDEDCALRAVDWGWQDLQGKLMVEQWTVSLPLTIFSS